MKQQILARIEALEQKRIEPPPEQEPEDREALALWYAQQHDFGKAGEVAGLDEDEAQSKVGEAPSALGQAVKQQCHECETYCQEQNARKPQPQEPEPEPPPPDLPPRLRYDKRRWGTTTQQRERAQRQQERGGARWRVGRGSEF